MKENIKKAFELAEQESQEKEINYLKSIIKNLLEKKKNLEEEKRDIEKEISVIKTTIYDFKSGRLDKVKEMIDKDEKASKLLPFKIMIINQPVITKPWNWTYRLEPINYPINSCGGSGTCTYATSSLNDTSYTCLSSYTGTNYATITQGTYEVNGRIINL